VLEALWNQLRPSAVSAVRWRDAFAELAACYREPHRHYHDLEHLTEMAALLTGEAGRVIDRFAVTMAMFFHDAVLIPGARDNEERSAALARARLGPLVSAATMTRIEELVLATRGHDHRADDGDRTLLLDADLAILAAPPARFRAYDRGIRAEYGHLSDAVFAAGRRHFLEGLLARDAIFGDPTLRRTLEPAARANLIAALQPERLP
jgi:predicted metal-dependent HD superfamily phosphohydrolase